MKEVVKKFKSLNISRVICFKGTEEDILKAEKMEEDAGKLVQSIYQNPSFMGMEWFETFTDKNGNVKKFRRILTKSTRKGVGFQLSYFDNYDKPTMHENYIRTSQDAVNECIHDEKDLLRYLTGRFIFEGCNDWIVRILYR